MADPELLSATLFDVAAGPNGDGFLAVGQVTADKSAAMWASKDGASWTRITDPSFKGVVQFTAAVATPDSIVIVGNDNAAQTAASWLGK